MSEQEFHNKRKPFYIHPETLLVKFPTEKHMNVSHAQWFSEVGIMYLHTMRGYYMKDEYIMIYVNDFETPDVNVKLLAYLFEYFPTIKWIGLGCNKGEVGQVWTPKLRVTRGI